MVPGAPRGRRRPPAQVLSLHRFVPCRLTLSWGGKEVYTQCPEPRRRVSFIHLSARTLLGRVVLFCVVRLKASVINHMIWGKPRPGDWGSMMFRVVPALREVPPGSGRVSSSSFAMQRL